MKKILITLDMRNYYRMKRYKENLGLSWEKFILFMFNEIEENGEKEK